MLEERLEEPVSLVVQHDLVDQAWDLGAVAIKPLEWLTVGVDGDVGVGEVGVGRRPL
jgi:hypothetical protein